MADNSKAQTALTVQQRAGAMATEAIARFRGLDSARRTRLMGVAALVIGCFAALLWYSTRTDWRTLYAGLDPDDAREMAQELTTAGIPYDVSPDGGALRVPAENLDKARLATTAKGGPKSGRMGFELFDKPNWMGSEFDEKVNYQRALEGELEHTIGTLASVQSARVHLVLPHDSLFTTEQRDAKASVVLRLRHRTLAPEEADAVANLVASAVDDLRPENVVLVNAEGGGLLGKPTGDAALASHEQELAQKLVETLEPVAGAGNVRASVNVDYDPIAADEVDETYDPAQSVTLSMQRTEQSSGQPAASGIPGTASNAPNGQTAKPPLYPPQNDSLQNMKQESDTYGVSKKVRHTVEAAGRVRRLTAAVLINDRRVMHGKQESWEARTPEEMKRITDLAQSAIGFDTTRGDQVSVEEMAFDDNAAVPAAPLSERLLGMASQSAALIRYGTILAALLVFVFLVVRPAMRSLTAPPVARRVAATSSALPAQPPPQELTEEEHAAEQKKLRAQTVFEQVSEHVKREPAQSTRLLESWIRSE
jgi:flagellar M-ring protein FliF